MYPTLYETDDEGELTGEVTFYCSDQCRLAGVPYLSTMFGEDTPDCDDYVCPICQKRLDINHTLDICR